jgi:hypothetical protein
MSAGCAMSQCRTITKRMESPLSTPANPNANEKLNAYSSEERRLSCRDSYALTVRSSQVWGTMY